MENKGEEYNFPSDTDTMVSGLTRIMGATHQEDQHRSSTQTQQDQGLIVCLLKLTFNF